MTGVAYLLYFQKNIRLPALAVVLSNMGDIKLKDSYTEIIKVIQFLKQISSCGCEFSVLDTKDHKEDSQPYKKPKHQRINDTLTKQLCVDGELESGWHSALNYVRYF